jgi:selenocysteine-specific elongation factor
MRRLILGTAGHIDHGKTALVKALTGVDTDRLKEEKERGITVDLGFADLSPTADLHFGIVDVPGHEGFIRNMVAGASGMDVVLLVIAADEGVMPQTREHLAIIQLLGVKRLVVALTKTDLVEEGWLDLVLDDVTTTLAEGPYAKAPIVPTSVVTGEGLDELVGVLREHGEDTHARDAADIPRLPIDRVFTVKGTGTVVTGTLWSGTLRVGEPVKVLPGGPSGRVRGLQIHGGPVEEAGAGARVAVALAGGEVDRHALSRGQALVGGKGWDPSYIVTARVGVLPDTGGWKLEQGQRVRVHLGTAEVMARCALLGSATIEPGGHGWVQLRLEEPILARALDPFVLRSYSPMTTIGGGQVVEPSAAKRKSLASEEVELLEVLLAGDGLPALLALLQLTWWGGVARDELPIHLGSPPQALADILPALADEGGVSAAGRVFHPDVAEAGRELILGATSAYQRQEPLRPGIPLELLRQALPPVCAEILAEPLIRMLQESGKLEVREGFASTPGFQPTLEPDQEEKVERLRPIFREAGLAPPSIRELPAELGDPEEIRVLLRFMEGKGEVRALEDDLFFWQEALDSAGTHVSHSLGGKWGLGPADFKDLLGVTRKHLIPVLRYLDTKGVTVRRGEQREVPEV